MGMRNISLRAEDYREFGYIQIIGGRMARHVTAPFLIVALWGCSGPVTPKPQTPQQAMESMRGLAAESKWGAYWDCFSSRGKGWFIAESASALAWDAYAQPIDPKAGEGSRLFIEKWGVTKQNLQRKEGETSDAQCLRIAAFLGTRGPQYCEELFQRRRFPVFPGPEEIKVLEEKGDHAVLEFPPGMKCNLTKVEGRWRLDGPAGPE